MMDKDLLRRFIPFDGMQDEYLSEALEHLKIEQLSKGHMLFKRGRALSSRFFLVEGRVDLIDSQFQNKSIKGGSSEAMEMLNAEDPTLYSCIVKDDIAQVFSIESAILNRLTAWSENAESAFEAEMMARNSTPFDPVTTGQFDVITVDDEDSADDWMSALLKSPLFERVPLTHVQDLFSRFEELDAVAGERIIKEGERGDYFYVVAKGSVRITNRLDSVDITLSPGQHFGEEALLGSTLRNATATMLEDGQLKRLNSDDFKSLLTEPVLQYIDADALASLDKAHKIIDVKMPLEYRVSHVKGSINLPLARLRGTIPELARSKTYVVSDDAGNRSRIAAHLLCQAGFDTYILRGDVNSASQI